MNVSMNGLRRNLSDDVEQLKRQIEFVLGCDYSLQPHTKEALKDALNQVIQDSNILNCVFDESIPEFSDLSKLTVDPVDPEDE